jgi:hypothetical protein
MPSAIGPVWGHAIGRAGLYGKLSQLNPVGQAARKPADSLGFVLSQTVYTSIGTTPILPLNVAILASDTAFTSFPEHYPADVPSLSAYPIIRPVLWRHPGLRVGTALTEGTANFLVKARASERDGALS